MIDLVEFRTELKRGTFHTYIKRDKVYVEDSQTGECIMICDLKEIENERNNMYLNKEDLLVKTSDDKLPEPCSNYDEKTGRCKSSGKLCDTCYEHSLKVFDEYL